jgi:hypothetical protein
MNAATISNAKAPRKQLSDQLDRLDSILDGLGEGLNGAVAEATREGTRSAVRDAIVEILTDATLRTKLHQATAPETPAEPVDVDEKTGLWNRLKSYTKQTTESVSRMVSSAVTAAKDKASALGQKASEAVQSIRDLGTLKTTVLAVALTVAVVSYVAPHSASAAISGISSALAVVALRFGVWLARTRRTLFIA